MRYILDVSGRDVELIKASIVNFERSLEMSSQGDFSHLIDELNDTYVSLKLQKTKQFLHPHQYYSDFDDFSTIRKRFEGAFEWY